MKIVSWNVNGLRASFERAVKPYLLQEMPDVLGLQETKIQDKTLPEAMRHFPGYHAYFHFAEKAGYSGVALYCKTKPDSVEMGFGDGSFDSEGRVISCTYGDLIIYSVYFPNGQQGPHRMDYKLAFYEAFFAHVNAQVQEGYKVLIGGDYNTAHHPIDLARPKENVKNSGFMPIERACMDRMQEQGWVDTFRHFYPTAKERYSWWNVRTRARERNIGWRIDSWWANSELVPQIQDAFIQDKIEGSDHCPVGVVLAL